MQPNISIDGVYWCVYCAHDDSTYVAMDNTVYRYSTPIGNMYTGTTINAGADKRKEQTQHSQSYD